MQTTNWSRDLGVEVGGDDVVSHTGSVIVRMLADKTGLTSALSGALARPDVIGDRYAVFRDMAVIIADGGTHICDLEVLGTQQRPPGEARPERGPSHSYRLVVLMAGILRRHF